MEKDFGEAEREGAVEDGEVGVRGGGGVELQAVVSVGEVDGHLVGHHLGGGRRVEERRFVVVEEEEDFHVGFEREGEGAGVDSGVVGYEAESGAGGSVTVVMVIIRGILFFPVHAILTPMVTLGIHGITMVTLVIHGITMVTFTINDTLQTTNATPITSTNTTNTTNTPINSTNRPTERQLGLTTRRRIERGGREERRKRKRRAQGKRGPEEKRRNAMEGSRNGNGTDSNALGWRSVDANGHDERRRNRSKLIRSRDVKKKGTVRTGIVRR